MAQGLKQNVAMLDFTASWQIWTNFFVDFKQFWRREILAGKQPLPDFSMSALSVRWNMAQRLHEF
jgi:hypothetical protein